MVFTIDEKFRSYRILSEMFSTPDERLLKRRVETVTRDFYPFVEEGTNADEGSPTGETSCEVQHPARIAVYDDASAAPRVVVIEPCDVRDYLEQITATVNRLSHEQGGSIPFMVIREIVENFIHAYFQSPTITILDGGNTIRFSDQGPGIKEKSLALEYGTSSATEEMKRYIRGVGSGLPYVQQYMTDKGGSLDIEDNIAGGTVVTISTHPREQARVVSGVEAAQTRPSQPWGYDQAPSAAQPVMYQGAPWPQQPAWGHPQPAWTQPQPAIQVDERGQQVLAFLADHELVGPTELVRTYGSSSATWSRALASLSAQGIIIKVGQKYQLTTIGRSFASI